MPDPAVFVKHGPDTKPLSEARRVEAQPQVASGVSRIKKSILLIDDDNGIRKSFGIALPVFLRSDEYKIDLTVTAPDTISEVFRKLSTEAFDMVLLDGELGKFIVGTKGHEVAIAIRSGSYGQVNQNVTIIDISTLHDTSSVLKVEHISKSHITGSEGLARIWKALVQDGQTAKV